MHTDKSIEELILEKLGKKKLTYNDIMNIEKDLLEAFAKIKALTLE